MTGPSHGTSTQNVSDYSHWHAMFHKSRGADKPVSVIGGFSQITTSWHGNARGNASRIQLLALFDGKGRTPSRTASDAELSEFPSLLAWPSCWKITRVVGDLRLPDVHAMSPRYGKCLFPFQVVPKTSMDALHDATVHSGRQYSKRHHSPCPLMYAYYGTEYLGRNTTVACQVCLPLCACVCHIGGLVQERRNSSALAMELRLSRTNPPICTYYSQHASLSAWQESRIGVPFSSQFPFPLPQFEISKGVSNSHMYYDYQNMLH